MSNDSTRLEIGHVLFIDIVGYSKLRRKPAPIRDAPVIGYQLFVIGFLLRSSVPLTNNNN
jgi:hypothetical protein